MVKRMTFLVPHEQTPEQRAIRALFAKIGLAIRKVSIEVDFEYLISGDEYYFLDTYDPKVLYLFPEDVSDERVRASIGMRKSRQPLSSSQQQSDLQQLLTQEQDLFQN